MSNIKFAPKQNMTVSDLISKKGEKSGGTPVNPAVTAYEKFVYVDGPKRALELAFNTGENLILFGKAGHGKSELTEGFFATKGIEPFVKTMGSGTTTDSLFGGIDIREFNESGKLEYLVENSFMNHEYVVFEELFDAPDYILEQLKDILTSKKFRNGTQVFEIKTKLIICCTNRTREEFSKNDSLQALTERFPLEYKVEWAAYNRSTYDFMFTELLGKSYPEIAFISEKLHAAGITVSPRTAIKAAKIWEKCNGDPSCLEFIADFSGKNRQMVVAELKKFEGVKKLESEVAGLNKLAKEFTKIKLSSLPEIKAAKNILTSIAEGIKKLQSQKIEDSLVKEMNNNINNFENFVKTNTQKLQDALV